MKLKIKEKEWLPMTQELLNWYKLNHRELPWRSSKEAYKVWLSEIILQQTRVAQGMSYYLRFCQNYATLADFAKAPLDDILKLWQGLGYYSRARNMHKCANQIISEFDGAFPQSYSELIKLIGIGKYTAGAIASICFDEAVPAIDGNAFRVYSRLFHISEDISKASTFKTFFELGQEIIPNDQSGDFNQAIMELGATICLPKNPKCEDCPIQHYCVARAKKAQQALPVKSKKVKVSQRYFNYLVLIHDSQVLIRQRGPKDIWQGLYDFPLIETKNHTKNRIFEFLNEQKWKDFEVLHRTEEYKHILTHQRLHIYFDVIEVRNWQDFKVFCQDNELERHEISELETLAVPKPIERFLQDEFPIQ
ncbi:A/G-specific adenine glycosylase [Reichenbachiella ulvae]|uniref:Adenine DNA glycosylase n=1 Tax=Reichenbachiella ulvae TaxID=2980104 RepID=A0ABT3CZA4_9BACT|nr:A/G-specific adenine glycosylase [Reichenbachiella ulvae]MCV9388543.1 A/G-specific adenine glycosylase [Reichenbachiella ulvae]